jgi:hypothetical protein
VHAGFLYFRSRYSGFLAQTMADNDFFLVKEKVQQPHASICAAASCASPEYAAHRFHPADNLRVGGEADAQIPAKDQLLAWRTGVRPLNADCSGTPWQDNLHRLTCTIQHPTLAGL